MVQITADQDRELGPRMHDGLLIWQTWKERPSSDIFAYDMEGGKLIPVAVSDAHLQSRAFVSNGRVLLTQEPHPDAFDAGRPSYLVLWTRETETSRVLDTGMNGSHDSFGFDGEWVIFTNRNDPDSPRNGLYAYHVDDGRLVHLYTPVYEHPDGMRENVQTFAIDGGKAYYVMQRFYPEDASDTRPTDSELVEGEYGEFTVYQVDLDTEGKRIVYQGGVPVVILEADGRWLAANADLRMWILDLEAAEPDFVEVSTDQSRYFALSEEWLVFDEGRLPTTITAFAYHLPSSTRHVIAADDQGGVGRNEIGLLDVATDGHQVVFALHRTYRENFSALGDDLYFFDLTPLRGNT